jgi:CrcB protein
MMPVWLRILVVAAGGALGANTRYWVGLAVSRWAGDRYPWSTFVVNVTGSLAIGVLAQVLMKSHPHSGPRLLLIAGFLGSYTTFSSFSLEGLALWQRGEARSALLYLGGSVLSGFIAVLAGILLADAVIAARQRF